MLHRSADQPGWTQNLGKSEEVAGTLMMLELKGVVRQVGQMTYVLAH